MEDSTKKEYADFQQKVLRTVYLDNLSSQVTEPVLKTAINQFGNVTNVEFIPNYTMPMNVSSCALVEMENSKQAEAVVIELSSFPFMISGMPRPVRARPAEAEMFDNRPTKPGRKIQCRWLDKGDADFEVAVKLRQLAKNHASEAALLVKLQLQEEEKLANQQSETLKVNYGKFEKIENVVADGTVRHLASRYGMKLLEDK